MPQITSIGIAVPPFTITQSSAQAFARNLFADSFKDIDRLLPVFEHARIEKRHFCVPLEWFAQKHDPEEKNQLYIENATRLSMEAAQNCLNGTRFTREQIDHLIFISSTGLATPSLDAHIINKLNLRSDIKRTPIWGLGCAGGAVGLSRAFEYARAFPESTVLLIAVELCGLTFLRDDLSKSNLIATSLFAEGAAAALITGDQHPLNRHAGQPAPCILNTRSVIWKDTLDIMGWDITRDGLKVIFSRDIPGIVEKWMAPEVETFLSQNDLSRKHIAHFITHPGGMKVLKAYEKALNLQPEDLRHAYQVLRGYGNMSSATVLFVLARYLQDQPAEGDYGLISALGPGFSGEFLLVKWK
ncbi:MAG: type III polyketide synthase [Bacillaceae bacterium]|nr:type III polyketide synthase [Bacillaceae bacterium]